MTAIGTSIGIPFSKSAFDWSSYWETRYASDLDVSVITSTSIGLEWENNGDEDYDGVSIERSADNITFAEVDTVAAGETTFIDTVAEGVVYYYRIRYYSGSNYGAYANPNYLESANEPCFTFNGGGSVSTGVETHTRFFDGDGDLPFYISAWIYLTENGFYNIFSRSKEYLLQFLGGRLNFFIYNDAGTTIYLKQTTANTFVASMLNAWHHLLVTYDGSGTEGGMKGWLDKNPIAFSNASAGEYVGMSAFGSNFGFTLPSLSKVVDMKIGSGVPTEANRTSLYDNDAIGTEIVHWSCTEGYGSYLHNLVDNANPRTTATSTAPDDEWINTQTFYKHNYKNGITYLNDYRFPNLNYGGKFFAPIYGFIEAGQSNAASAFADTPDLVGTDYASLNVAGAVIDRALGFNTTWDKYVKGNIYDAVFGTNLIISFLIDEAGKDTFCINYGEATTGLYPGSSAIDWHPDTVGEHFDLLNADILDNLTKLALIHGREPFVKSFIWVHGEQDSSNSTWTAAYYDNLVAFFNKWKTQIATEINIQITQLGPYLATDDADLIRTAQALLASMYGNTSLISTADFDNTELHYGAADRIKLGERIFANMNVFTPSKSSSYLNKILPGYTKTYYSPQPI